MKNKKSDNNDMRVKRVKKLKQTLEEEEFEYYKIGADKGDPHALLNLGDLYYRGRGVKRNYIHAFKYYKMSAEKGNEKAKNYLNHIHYNRGLTPHKYSNNFSLTEQESEYYKLTFEYYKNTVINNNQNSDALLRLGDCYNYGIGTTKCVKQAIEYYTASANINDNSMAMYNVAKIHERSKPDLDPFTECYVLNARRQTYEQNVLKYYKLAFDCYKKHTDNGDSNAMYILGLMCEKLPDIPEIESTGIKYNDRVEYFEMSAHKGNLDALYKLATEYSRYNTKTYQKKIDYYKICVERGHQEAMIDLANIYMENDRDDYKNIYPLLKRDFMVAYELIQLSRMIRKYELNVFGQPDPIIIQYGKSITEYGPLENELFDAKKFAVCIMFEQYLIKDVANMIINYAYY